MNYLVLIKTAVGAVKTIEQLMPESTGKEKADAAIALLEEVFGDVTGALPALTVLFTTVVNGLRALGLFKAKAAPVAT